MRSALTLVAPVYNEAENVEALVRAAAENIRHDYGLWCVYDDESDSTLPVLRELLPSHPELKIIKNAYGKGALQAIRTGLNAAPPGAVIVTMADLSDDYTVVDEMFELFEQGYDLVCASRYMKGGRQIGGPFIKGTMSRLAGLSLHYLTGIPTRDVTNSFKLYSKDLIDAINVESTGSFEIGMEIAIKAYSAGYRITEVPASWTDRTAGESNFNVRALLPHYIHWYFFALRGLLLRRPKSRDGAR